MFWVSPHWIRAKVVNCLATLLLDYRLSIRVAKFYNFRYGTLASLSWLSGIFA
jgi:hypothetical protein